MGKEWFSVERLTALDALRPGAPIHVIGVSGVAMAQMAVALSERGFRVTGSDKEFYEPMGSFLKNSAVQLCRGYDAKNVPEQCDLVLIGNAVSYGHPEVAVVEQRGLAYTIFPKLLCDLAITGRHSIVVSGTHGKTTTTGMCASALTSLGAAPSFFVGGAVPGFVSGLQIGTGAYSVVEGDEYDSCFFAKVPKFTFYKPQSLIVNAIEYDHADIYPNLAAIDAEFEKLVCSVPRDGTVYFCVDGLHELQLSQRWSKSVAAQFVTFGSTAGADAVVASHSDGEEFQKVTVTSARLPHGEFKFRLRSPGLHNAKNAAACALVLHERGFPIDRIAMALEQFQGVRRRQDVRYRSDQVTVIDDFAHHPTAVRETIAAVKQRYPSHSILAVFEPRSNTSRRKVFQTDYVDAFRQANEALFCLPQARGAGDDILLDVGELAAEIHKASGIPSEALADAPQILAALTGRKYSRTVILVMSNGGFGGLVQQLVDFFSKNN